VLRVRRNVLGLLLILRNTTAYSVTLAPSADPPHCRPLIRGPAVAVVDVSRSLASPTVLPGSDRELAWDRFFGPAPKVVSVHVFAALRRVVFDDQHSVQWH
jgi:hypothetical protein